MWWLRGPEHMIHIILRTHKEHATILWSSLKLYLINVSAKLRGEEKEDGNRAPPPTSLFVGFALFSLKAEFCTSPHIITRPRCQAALSPSLMLLLHKSYNPQSYSALGALPGNLIAARLSDQRYFKRWPQITSHFGRSCKQVAWLVSPFLSIYAAIAVNLHKVVTCM